MAHSCRWRFPARPGTGRRLGARQRLAAVLRDDASEGRIIPSSTGNAVAGCGTTGAPGGPVNCFGVGPGFDAALQVSAVIGNNLRRFRDVSGGSSGEEDAFLGFGTDEEVKSHSPTKSPKDQTTQRKPRGRPRNSSSRSSDTSSCTTENTVSTANKQESRLTEKAKKVECKPEEKRRGRPPTLGKDKLRLTQEKRDSSEPTTATQEEKTKRRKPSATFQQAAKIKKLIAVKLSPLKSKFKSNKLQLGRKAGVPIVRKRGRPPSSERFKASPQGSLLKQNQTEKAQKEVFPQLTNEDRVSVRQSPRRMKPVRIIPSSKRTDTAIAKQLLQKAKKGAQKKIEMEAAKLQGRKGGTQLKNIRQFIMPVVSTVSSRIIKTPRRFIEDEDYEPPIKIARLETVPSSGRFSTTSCGSSEKSSAASQHSSQATSDDSRSSSPSVDTSTESQVSEETPAVPEAPVRLAETLAPVPTPKQPLESNSGGVSRRRLPACNRTFSSRPAKKLISRPALQQQTSASPSPPLLSPPTPLQPPASLSDHTPWLMPPSIPMATSFLSASRMHEKRRSILREPTFRWTSLKHSRLESQYFSSAKYAKEGLIRKPIFDNFRPPPLTPEDVGLASASGFPSPTVLGPGRLFSPLHASGARFDVHKRSPILRAPRFTPSEAHSRIFESVTLPSSAGRSGVTSSMMGMSSRRAKRKVFSPIRSSEPRSPSHCMKTRSRRAGSNGLSVLTPSSTLLPGMSVSPLASSALNPSFPFSSTAMTPSPGDSSEKVQKVRKQSSTSGERFSSPSSGSSALFPWFPSSPQAEKGRSKGRASEEVHKEREAESSREKEREKENSRDSRKEKRKKGSDTAIKVVKEKNDGEGITTATSTTTLVKTPVRKKSGAAEPSLDSSSTILHTETTPAKIKASKKGRGSSEKTELDSSAKTPLTEAQAQIPAQIVNAPKHSTTTISSMLAQADKFPVSDKHVATLLRKAKAQLYKIEKSKFLKQADQLKPQGQESDSSETSVRGPRIKHVCRRAAVALGRKRAVFPDDMPTLSALPWEEREKVLSSMGNDDKSSIAGSEDADPPPPPLKPIKQVARSKIPQEPPVKKGRRSRRCGQCSGCQVPEDCGKCTNCLDKPKFGGRNIKKQCCKMRKCQNLQWMPSKAYLQKQAKAAKKKEKKSKVTDKKDIPTLKNPPEPTQKTVITTATNSLPVREDPLPPPPPAKKSEPPRKVVEEKPNEESLPAPSCETKQFPTPRKATKQLPQLPASNSLPPQACPPPPAKKEAQKTAPSESRKKPPPVASETSSEQNKQKKLAARLGALLKSKGKEKDKPLPPSKPEISFNLLSTLSNGGSSRQKPLSDGVHRIRVDFKEDCEVENVWEMGGLSILTTVPITPRVVCFLCASSGHVEFVYCQVCCEPFHRFCLEERERPSEDQLENWCCRHCKFCHVCGRQQQATKQLLECNKCRNSYHPECLGPNYPTKPTKKKRVWICTKCVRCKSCGSTTPGKGWDAQWSHDFSLCHDCAKLFAKGNFCPLCNKCYDDDDYESKMMQCGKCDRWVHSKCESLTDEMYEILSNLPESVAYTCINCTEHHPAEWRLALTNELQASLKYVLTALLNSRTSSHLLRYRQAAKPPDLNPEPEENMPSRSSPEGPDPPILTQVSKQDEQPPPDLEGVKRKMDHGRYTSVLELSDDIVRIIQAAMNADGGQPELKKANSMVKSFFTRQMERVFPWFSVKKSRFWEPNKVTNNSSLLPNAVLPPSLDHNYAQWQERENSLAVQPMLMKKIIPAPKPKSPGDPESPQPMHSPTPPVMALEQNREESPVLPPPPGVEDNRQCALCLKYGDDNANDAGRLLFIGQDEWTHVNCALWSAEVFEDDDGSLKNVHMAVIRGKQLRCELCLKLGATVGCCLTSCTSNYHFMCSRIKNCVFLEDKKVYCQKHRELIKGEIVPDNGFEVSRRVFVDFEGINLRRKFLNGLEPENIHMMIGSMTVDCLGILTDLSECEEKLFPIGYQCSRVYWSTTDARKRCVYTCKILECRPPPTDPDVNSTLQHEENRTIAHSLPTLTSDMQESQSADSVKCIETLCLPSLDPLTASPASTSWVTSRPPGVRSRPPRYSPTQRSPGSRPLPSAGSPSPVTHEIVTVGDPLLSSGLRRIGSRRHSASSNSPQQQRPCLTTPPRPDTSRIGMSAISTTVTSADHSTNGENFLLTTSTALVKSSCSPNNGSKTTESKEEKPLEGRRVVAVETLAKVTTLKPDKARSSSPRTSDASTHNLTLKIPSQTQEMVTPDSSTSRAGALKDTVPVLLNVKSSPTLQLQRTSKREKDKNANPSLVEKSTSLEERKDSQIPTSNHGISVTKDRRAKSKKSQLDNSKEKHSSKPTSDTELAPGDSQQQSDASENHVMSESARLKTHVHSKSNEKCVHNAGISQLESTGKMTPTMMGTDEPCEREREKQISSPQKVELPDIVKPQDASESTGDIGSNHTSSNADSEPQAGNSFPVQDSNLLLQDESKTQEEGAYKRRYPRRSARARSNMFFGLTPLYGVRSYGEEDLPFCSSTSGKKKGKRSAEGQVDGADDISTSEDDDVYYYNFSRTVVSSGDDRLATRTLFREEDQRDLHSIPQLDGVDDGTESDTSVAVTTGKSSQVGKRSSKQNGAEKHERSEQAEKAHVGKSHKATDTKIENCHPVKQDSLEAQLTLDTPRRGHSGAEKNLLDTFNSELLKSDSDNNNSDDCGNILPIDIMDFVLKNTPSMQALGESPESSSSELLTLSDGLGLDSNRGKDMGLFDVFSQQLPTSEPVDGAVPSTMSAEEQFELPLELPSDLSVLTTRSPALPSQNHSRLGVISESQLSSSGERSLLSIPTSSDTVEKRVSVTEKPGASGDGDQALLGQSVDRTPEGHMTPDRFISGHIDSDHISSPPCGQVDHAGSQEMTRNSSTPSLQVPVSPTVPHQNQKYIPNSTESPGPSQIPNSSIQSPPQHLKSSTEKLVVVNQNMQPLYVLQTLPNGVTQKIQLTPSVPPGTSRLEGDVPVLSPMGGGLTLATTLNPALTTPFPPASKGLLPMSHHPHLQPFPPGPQATFLPNLSNQPSGLLIGVQPSPEPQRLVSETGQRSDLGSTSNTPVPSMNKKRPISRLHTRKNKKLAPSVAPTSRHAPDVVSNMTLINFAPPQLTAGLPNHPGLIDLGTLGNATSHRSIPNIIKRSKSGVMYFDQTPLLPQGVSASSSIGSAPGVIGLDTGHIAGQVPGLATGSPVLNVVSMQAASSAPPVTGHVTLTSPGILGPSELGSISNFLIKTSPQGLGIQDNHVTLPPGSGMFSQSSTAATMATTSSICVVPTSQSVGVTLAQQVNDTDCPYPLSHPMNRLINSRPQILPDSSSGSDPRSPTLQLLPEGEGKLTKLSSSSSLGMQRNPVLSPQKTKVKVKRQPTPTDKTSRKKHKTSHPTDSPPTARGSERVDKLTVSVSQGIHKSKIDVNDLQSSSSENSAMSEYPSGHLPVIPELQPPMKESCHPEPKQDDSRLPGEEDTGFSSPLMRLLQQEQSRQESSQELKPRTGLLFEISSDDGFQISASSIEEAWKSLTEKVQEARSNARLKQLSFAGVNGLRMLGIIHDAVLFLVEQLYGANRCHNYKFRFHRPAGEEEPPLNPHGSARAEMHRRKSTFDMFNFLASKHRQPPEYKPNDEEEEEVQLKSARRATSMDLPMPMRFRHLKKTSKEAVGVYRSPIHGRGLFCRRNIDAGEMVIEYSGNVIRSTLTDKREKYYDGKQGNPLSEQAAALQKLLTKMVFYVCLVCRNTWKTMLVKDFCFYNKISALLQSRRRSRDRIPLLSARTLTSGERQKEETLKADISQTIKGIGCYMFRIDDSEVVDATMHGNAARFINHSCEPNCYSRVIPIDGQKHIVIFAMRKIYRGEELTYDYKFPIEDASNKLACNCGTKKCRKFLN